ncbi:(2Fe-2S)-binding protein [Elstera cyanobacteriorum]|uniref:Bacterioferritin-associated ferredoxin n=1 Tax=Elstera cyanobacteriorum TaxID=2022747 RepID=A0A255XSC4_9PROT|nr:(2Fe-2S)-binding protein [Elstera cyanobacteriorum]MCK6441778.1 (2Fe-2S)-binding protein [Elstera cyanobacteriorum]OYQ19878.1 hypothetical protein CHR90_07095 [Elstera cyanobacteriorum]GFZ96196.1 hypothetical protein GCM10011497_28500 [Elstera cyanobacteriorum]
MIVCVCNALSERDMIRARESGAATLAALYKAHGCQVKCGRCVGHARSLLPEAPVERRRQMEPAGA